MSNKKINWLSLDDTVLKKAKDENKAIFISIGYDECHWCEVMHRDVFSDERVIEVLNRYFIAIKVDKNGCRDVQSYYQKVHQLINNRVGTSPLSIFCTPQNKPFFASTFVALESVQGSIEGMGFLELSTLIGEKIANNDESTYKNADEIEAFLQDEKHPTQATKLSEDFRYNFMHQLEKNYDKEYGGFSKAPKFAQTSTLKTLLHIATTYDDDRAKELLTHTLNSMLKGGFYDLVDGGFYKYSLDDSWSQVSSYKTICDNALLCDIYIDTFHTYKDEIYKTIALKLGEFLQTKLQSSKLNTAQKSIVLNTFFNLSSLDDRYINIASKNLETLLKSEDISCLDDYAYMSKLLLKTYNVTKDELHIINAQRLINNALARFYKDGDWYFSDAKFKTKADIFDSSGLCSVSVMVESLLSISHLLDDSKYEHFAFKTLEYNSFEVGSRAVLYPSMIEQVLKFAQKKQ